MLLYDPDPLDAWIGKVIETTKEGKYVDTETGKALSKQEGKKYVAYLQRHESRNEVARQADKLFHILDKYLPLQADETRAFVARFPERVHTLLPKVRKIRNKLRQDGGTDPATGEFTSQGDSSGHGSGDALLQLTAETAHTVTKHVTTESRLREGDTRGDSSKPSAALQGELPQPAERADHNEAHRARMVRRGSSPPDEDTPPDWGDDNQTDDDTTHDSWPWGESGRPSDQGHSEGIFGAKAQ